MGTFGTNDQTLYNKTNLPPKCERHSGLVKKKKKTGKDGRAQRNRLPITHCLKMTSGACLQSSFQNAYLWIHVADFPATQLPSKCWASELPPILGTRAVPWCQTRVCPAHTVDLRNENWPRAWFLRGQRLTLACYHPAVLPVILVLGTFWELGGSQWGVRKAVEWSHVAGLGAILALRFSPRAVPAPAGSLPLRTWGW